MVLGSSLPATCSPFALLPFSSQETEVVMFFVTQWRAVRTTFGAISAPEQSSNVPPVPTRRATTPGTAWSPSSLEPPKMLGSEDPVVTRAVTVASDVVSAAQPVIEESTRAAAGSQAHERTIQPE